MVAYMNYQSKCRGLARAGTFSGASIESIKGNSKIGVNEQYTGHQLSDRNMEIVGQFQWRSDFEQVVMSDTGRTYYRNKDGTQAQLAFPLPQNWEQINDTLHNEIHYRNMLTGESREDYPLPPGWEEKEYSNGKSIT